MKPPAIPPAIRSKLLIWAYLLSLAILLPAFDTPSIGADPGILITPNPQTPRSDPPKLLDSEVSTASAADQREPTPSILEQEKARRVIEHAFRDEYAKKVSRDGRLQLALTLLEKGRLTEDDPTGRYCMLQDARSLAIELGEPGIAVESIEELDDSHRISLLDEKIETLKRLDTAVSGSTGQGEIARIALRAMGQAVDRDDFLTARQFRQIAEVSARRSHLRDLNELVQRRVDEMTALHAEFTNVASALHSLQVKPDDPAANLQVGTYYAISLGDWPRGLPLLAKSNDNDLRRLALLELPSPNTPATQLEIADGWWNKGRLYRDGTLQRKNVLRHANLWYRRVLPQLQGLTEARVRRMVEDFQSLPERITFEEQEEQSEIVFLSDLAPEKVSVFRNRFAAKGLNDAGAPLKLNGRWTRKGLFTPPPTRGSSTVLYELPETTFNYFRATVGIEDSIGTRLKSPLVFEVWGDYQPLWKSEPITKSGVIQTCRVQILTVRRLELRVVCPGSDEYAWPVWGDPRLTMR